MQGSGEGDASLLQRERRAPFGLTLSAKVTLAGAKFRSVTCIAVLSSIGTVSPFCCLVSFKVFINSAVSVST